MWHSYLAACKRRRRISCRDFSRRYQSRLQLCGTSRVAPKKWKLKAHCKVLESSTIIRTAQSGRSEAWLSRLVRDQEVGGSNPLAPTNFFPISDSQLQQLMATSFCLRTSVMRSLAGAAATPCPLLPTRAASSRESTCRWMVAQLPNNPAAPGCGRKRQRGMNGPAKL
jgi:hypothetical protein